MDFPSGFSFRDFSEDLHGFSLTVRYLWLRVQHCGHRPGRPRCKDPASCSFPCVVQGYAQYLSIRAHSTPLGEDTRAHTSASGSCSELLVSLALYFFCKFIRRPESKGQAGHPFGITSAPFQDPEHRNQLTSASAFTLRFRIPSPPPQVH